MFFFGTLCISRHSVLLILRFWQGGTDSRVRLSIKSLHAKEPHPQRSLRDVRYPGAVTSASDGDTTLQGCRGRSCVADQLETERETSSALCTNELPFVTTQRLSSLGCVEVSESAESILSYEYMVTPSLRKQAQPRFSMTWDSRPWKNGMVARNKYR